METAASRVRFPHVCTYYIPQLPTIFFLTPLTNRKPPSATKALYKVMGTKIIHE